MSQKAFIFRRERLPWTLGCRYEHNVKTDFGKHDVMLELEKSG
jgi:hypothetical protein